MSECVHKAHINNIDRTFLLSQNLTFFFLETFADSRYVLRRRRVRNTNDFPVRKYFIDNETDFPSIIYEVGIDLSLVYASKYCFELKDVIEIFYSAS